MGTSRVISTTEDGKGTRVYTLPYSFKSGTSIADLDGTTIAPGGGATNGILTGYQPSEYLQTPGHNGSLTVPLSLPSKWVMFDSDLERAPHDAATLLNPLSVDMTTVIPIALGPATRVVFSVRSQADTHTTSPVIVPWLIWGKWDAANKRFWGVEAIERADAATAAASGLTLTLPAVAASATLADSWLMGNSFPDRTGYDTAGAPYLLVLRATAGAVSGGGNLLQGICRLSN